MNKATIYYHDIGDYLTREEKLRIVQRFGSVENPEMKWQTLEPNEHGDWLNLRNNAFGEFIAMGDKDNKENKSTYFIPFYSNGVKTQRDAWCYNSSKTELERNIQRTLDFYNEQRKAFAEAKGINPNLKARDFISYDDTKFSWSDNPIYGIDTNKIYEFDENNVVRAMYRPFFRQIMYFNRSLNERVYQMPKLFPAPDTQNRVICVAGVGVTKDFTTLITDIIPDLEVVGKSQCFPLYYYEERVKTETTLFDGGLEQTEYVRRDGISDWILERAQRQYGGNVSKEDIFYYVYGFLHSPDYRAAFANDLKKMLPRLPLVDAPNDFWRFSKAGRKLAELHINYETAASIAEPPAGVVVNYAPTLTTNSAAVNYRVEKMRFPAKDNKSAIHYNSQITITDIPSAAYDYVVNGKSAIEWVMERYQITTHKESGIRNDPNDWAAETGNPHYILDLLLSVIRVSVETMEIVRGLPAVKF